MASQDIPFRPRWRAVGDPQGPVQELPTGAVRARPQMVRGTGTEPDTFRQRITTVDTRPSRPVQRDISQVTEPPIQHHVTGATVNRRQDTPNPSIVVLGHHGAQLVEEARQLASRLGDLSPTHGVIAQSGNLRVDDGDRPWHQILWRRQVVSVQCHPKRLYKLIHVRCSQLFDERLAGQLGHIHL